MLVSATSGGENGTGNSSTTVTAKEGLTDPGKSVVNNDTGNADT